MKQEFALLYMVPGLTDIGLERRTRREREWLLKELASQKSAEAEASRRAASGIKAPRRH